MASIGILSAPWLDNRSCSLDVPLLDKLCADSIAARDAVEALVQAPSVEAAPAQEEDENVIRARKYVQSSWQYQVTTSGGAAAALAGCKARRLAHGGPAALQKFAQELISGLSLDDTFYVYDLGNATRLLKAWRGTMPRVTPFYAVKCNPEPAIISLLKGLGAGFDCASRAELDLVTSLGVHPSRIIFAHPCKRPSEIVHAASLHVDLTTFDTESELHKLAAAAAGGATMRCVLRIRADDPTAKVQLGLKYGADPADAPELLALARELGLKVVGVSFHVGSSCQNLGAFTGAIEAARAIFDMAEEMGFEMELLDIGGGFTGKFDARGNVIFGEIALTINAALAAHFPADSGVRVIAEPGRYFAETSGTLFTPIYGQRGRTPPAGGPPRREYWVTDGLYGSFNCILYDYQSPTCRVVRSPLLPPTTPAADADLHPSTLWGPTCDSADVIYPDIPLPLLRNGDWLMFPSSGAYTVAGACDFNGINMTAPAKFFMFSECAVDEVEAEEVEGLGEEGSGPLE